MKAITKYLFTLAGIIVVSAILFSSTNLFQVWLVRSKLINIDAFPTGWVVNGVPHKVPSAPLGGRGSIASISNTFVSPEIAGADEAIYLFDSPAAAHRYFERLYEQLFREDVWSDSWDDFGSLVDPAPHADQYTLACDTSVVVTPMQGCNYLARYGSFVVLFDIDWVQEGSVKYSDILTIVQAIDDQF